MLVLALDTTTSSGSCALARDGRVVCEQVNDAPNAHAEHLPGDLMSLLESAGVTLADIDVFAVATGPGSFTGLRIGIATMQGLAFAERKPLVGVSGFDALARMAYESLPRRSPEAKAGVATWVAAWRGEVFAALYEDGREVEVPIVGRPEVLLEALRARPTLFIGDGAREHAETIRRLLGEAARIAEPPAPPLAGTIAILAGEAPITADHSPHAIRPLYIRRIDAELSRDARVLRSTAEFWIDPLDGDEDLDGVLAVEEESFTNPWTKEMYAWELQNRAVCHIFVVRTPDQRVVGFCAFWLVIDEIHINNVAIRPALRGQGIGTHLMRRVFDEAKRLGARRATLEVRRSNESARRLYERLGFAVTGTRPNYYTNPVEDALILWRDEP